MALGEFARIKTYFAPLATAPGAMCLTDDAAFLQPRAGYDLVLTQDAMVEGVHFLAEDPAEDVARKLLRVNLSDLAAKGAAPLGYLLTCAWTAKTPEKWIAGFAEGLKSDQERFGLSLLGGDTVATPGPLSFSLTAIGEVPEGGMISRRGAKMGDWVFVTGTIGDAALGLDVLQGKVTPELAQDRDALIERFRRPVPRLEIGVGIRDLASAALDISDGLMGDAGHLAELAGCCLRFQADEIPLSDPARRCLSQGQVKLERLLTGGDDYELVFTAAPQVIAGITEIGAAAGVEITRIGEVVAGSGVELLDCDQKIISIKSKSYQHF